jgi:hypothetical protein
MNTYYTVTSGNGMSLGRMTVNAPLTWVEPQFAACYTDAADAKRDAEATFGIFALEAVIVQVFGAQA